MKIFSRGAKSNTSAGKVNKVLGPENADDIAKGIIRYHINNVLWKSFDSRK